MIYIIITKDCYPRQVQDVRYWLKVIKLIHFKQLTLMQEHLSKKKIRAVLCVVLNFEEEDC